MFDLASSPVSELSARVERMLTTLGERLTHLDREILREAVRRAGERDGVVEALLDRNLQWGRSWSATACWRSRGRAGLALGGLAERH